MSKKHKHPEHVNLERWLVSYADFITLLFAFFVVLFASSQVDRSKTKKMALAIESAFNRFSIFRDQPGNPMSQGEELGSGGNANQYHEYLVEQDHEKMVFTPQLIESEEGGLAPPTADEALDINTGFMSSQEQALAHARRDLLKLLEQYKLDATIKVKWDERGVIISVRDAGIFESGAEKLTIKSEQFLREVARIVSQIPNQVRVEGHTDNKKTDAFNSNWALSSARASYIIEWFLREYKMNPARFSAVGYGEYRPIADNSIEEGRQQNRRVDIILLSEAAARKESPMNDDSMDMPSRSKPAPVILPRFKEREYNPDDELKRAIEKSYDAYNRTSPDIPTVLN